MTLQRHLHQDVDRLQTRLVGMAGIAGEMVRLAVEALRERDFAKATLAMERDEALDAAELEIEDLAVALLGRQQPTPRDLRMILTAIKISSALERVGGHAVDIAEEARSAPDETALPGLPELEEMSRIAVAMLGDVLDAFVRRDSALARATSEREARMNELRDNIFRVLLTHMMEDPRRIRPGMGMFQVSRSLERIADLATDIAGDVVFLVDGRSMKLACAPVAGHNAPLEEPEAAGTP